ncbi:hypothetical protein FRC12_014747 [Ceratobasidium sp. 428]|nr:hypothetical protein FRC12_014747 [Ceratobasidium sp. 428]
MPHPSSRLYLRSPRVSGCLLSNSGTHWNPFYSVISCITSRYTSTAFQRSGLQESAFFIRTSMSNQPPHEGSPSKSRHRNKGDPNAGPRFRKNTGGNNSNHNVPANANNQPNEVANSGANNTTNTNTGIISVHGSPAPQHQNPHQHVQQVHQHTRTQPPRTPHVSAPPPRMVQSASTSAHSHSPNIIYSHSPNLIHPHAHAAAFHAYSPQPGRSPSIPHSSHSPHPNRSPHPSHPSHSPTLSRTGQSPSIVHSHSQPFHSHGHSPSLHTSPHFPPVRTPTFPHAHPPSHHVYPSPSPRPRPMSMHAGMAVGIGSVPGTPSMSYGTSGGMNMGLNMNVNMGAGMGMGMTAYEGQAIHTHVPDTGSANVHASNADNSAGAGAQNDQNAAFNLCRRRVVAPGMEGQSSAFAASIDPELAGIAVRVANPQPLLLPSGFLWEFEIPRGIVPASLINAILNVTQTAIPLLLESRPADTCARGEHTASDAYICHSSVSKHTPTGRRNAQNGSRKEPSCIPGMGEYLTSRGHISHYRTVWGNPLHYGCAKVGFQTYHSDRRGKCWSLRGLPYKAAVRTGRRWYVGGQCHPHERFYRMASPNSRCGSCEPSQYSCFRALKSWNGHMSFWSQSASSGGYIGGRASLEETQICPSWTAGNLFQTLFSSCFSTAFREVAIAHASAFDTSLLLCLG